MARGEHIAYTLCDEQACTVPRSRRGWFKTVVGWVPRRFGAGAGKRAGRVGCRSSLVCACV